MSSAVSIDTGPRRHGGIDKGASCTDGSMISNLAPPEQRGTCAQPCAIAELRIITVGLPHRASLVYDKSVRISALSENCANTMDDQENVGHLRIKGAIERMKAFVKKIHLIYEVPIRTGTPERVGEKPEKHEILIRIKMTKLYLAVRAITL